MITLTALTSEHLGGVAELERLSFSEPWSENSLSLLLDGNNFGIVALDGDAVVAYVGVTCVLDEGSVTNVATHPDHRRRGIGRQILRRMLAEAADRGIASVFLEVRESNSAARALYASEGFSECGVRRNFYSHPVESAVQMVYYINEK